jgi:hypothetical protein
MEMFFKEILFMDRNRGKGRLIFLMGVGLREHGKMTLLMALGSFSLLMGM